ncbi:DNA polymerase III subunit delta' [Pukyongiella litopenaei]|uniref:DNA polymerase III subunit delta n=1 Tax=Pukyongiella litopenaei TaxID=2605946 RepID=A0A2S0MN85_9RHOB|nr:DNA polymerase III subunit delta' [Pukyongiella litopenaei]AVO37306.1 DNA polymerase III subunit delta' [Pukyongiella litopenaei]
MTDAPAPDRIDGAPHPRETGRLFGQHPAEAGFLDAFNAGRMHHGWLLSGPRGVGKATLAWRIARFLLAAPAADDGLFGAPPPAAPLDIGPDHPVARQIAAGTTQGLACVTRTVNDKTDKLRGEIVVDDIRRLREFFALSAPDGGRRVVIVDAADDMNISAANALLKMLEEPPRGATLLLVSHQPSRLLPTIRSRCRSLRLSPLGPDDLALALDQAGAPAVENPDHLTALAGGSVGAALRLIHLGGQEIYAELVAILGAMPRPDRQRALRLAETMTGPRAQDRFDLALDLIDIALARLARCGAAGAPPMPEAAPGEAGMLARLAPSAAAARAWADTAAQVADRTRRGRAVNLDPAALVLDTVFSIQQTAAGQARQQA